MNGDTDDILSLHDLRIGYHIGKKRFELLPALSAVAKKGELIAIIGRNGIGKSTLLRTIIGLQQSLGGSVLISGKNLNEYSKKDLAQSIGYISTEPVKVSNMSVYDLVSLGRYPYTNWVGNIDCTNHEIIMNAMEKVSISHFHDKYITELSDGERQKALIARILAQDTDIMIMDEPTAFLDIGSKYEILHILHQLTRDNNKTIIFSTHDFQMAIGQSDKIWLMNDKEINEGAPEDLLSQGAFDNLFNSNNVRFDSASGSFAFACEKGRAFYIEGSGIQRHWTEEALKRVGYSISKEKTSIFISISTTQRGIWNLVSEKNRIEFTSIYELMNYLKDFDKMAI